MSMSTCETFSLDLHVRRETARMISMQCQRQFCQKTSALILASFAYIRGRPQCSQPMR